MNEQVVVILVTATSCPEQFITGSWMCVHLHIVCDVFHHTTAARCSNWTETIKMGLRSAVASLVKHLQLAPVAILSFCFLSDKLIYQVIQLQASFICDDPLIHLCYKE